MKILHNLLGGTLIGLIALNIKPIEPLYLKSELETLNRQSLKANQGGEIKLSTVGESDIENSSKSTLDIKDDTGNYSIVLNELLSEGSVWENIRVLPNGKRSRGKVIKHSQYACWEDVNMNLAQGGLTTPDGIVIPKIDKGEVGLKSCKEK